MGLIWGQLVIRWPGGKYTWSGLDSRMRGNDKQVVVPAKAGTFRVRPGPTDVHD